MTNPDATENAGPPSRDPETESPRRSDDGFGAAGREQSIGPYRIVELIGSGGQGAVYRAEDRRVGRMVALKVLHGARGLAAELLLRFRREAEITAKLDHPSICPVYEVGVDDLVPFIAMRLVEGRTLSAHISSARSRVAADDPSTSFVDFVEADGDADTHILTPAERSGPVPGGEERRAPSSSGGTPQHRREIFDILSVIERIAAALHVAHEAGIVHRDIKPGNIMIQRDGTPVILDFGLAYDESAEGPSLSITGALMGTPAYMAPEQIAAKRIRVDRRADIFSLGVTLFECLTLTRPFDAATKEGLLHAISFKDPPAPRSLNPAIPRDVEIVVRKALEKDPDIRFQTAAEFADELRRIRSFEPIRTRPAPPWVRHVRWIQRNPGWAVAVYGIFIALSILAATFSVKNRQLEKKTAEAEANAQRAEREAEAKSAALDAKSRAVKDYERLADTTLFAAMAKDADDLYPIGPSLVARIDAFKDRYMPLIRRLPEHEAALAELEARAAPYTMADRERDYPAEVERLRNPELEPEEREAAMRRLAELPRRSANFGDDAKSQFRYDTLAMLVRDMRAFTAPRVGELASIERRLEDSRAFRRLTVTEHEKAWQDALRRIRQSPSYGGLDMHEQVGLIPLGPDPDSGLEEFAETLTGEVPSREADGRLRTVERSAIVFVLIPGGPFLMGAQSRDPSVPNHVAAAMDHEGPVHRVGVSPFFLSKYEMTQGQWMRTSRKEPKNPANYVLAKHPEYGARFKDDRRRPIEQISWTDAARRLRQLGYELPSEEEWEYACRAGCGDPWSFGADRSRIVRHANCADKSFHGIFPAESYDGTIDDGHAIPAPVGSYLPNAFGLYDMHGNVSEWCADHSHPYGPSAADSRPAPPADDSYGRIFRGGSYWDSPESSYSARRDRQDPISVDDTIGCRPKRRVD